MLQRSRIMGNIKTKEKKAVNEEIRLMEEPTRKLIQDLYEMTRDVGKILIAANELAAEKKPNNHSAVFAGEHNNSNGNSLLGKKGRKGGSRKLKSKQNITRKSMK